MSRDYFEQIDAGGHEAVIFCHHRDSGLRALIAIHDTTLGPAAGGTRRWVYREESEALQDVLRLSQGMTLKCAAAGLDYGGGKIVMLAQAGAAPSRAQYRALGECLERLQGGFITGEDVGTGERELGWLAERTRWAVGLSTAAGLSKPETSAQTALGVELGMQACLQHVRGRPGWDGTVVAVQGLGHVGMKLVRSLAPQGVRLLVTDLDESRAAAAVQEWGAQSVEPQRIFEVDCDVFAPCALGGVLNRETIPRLACRIVAGSANNQLQDEQDAQGLARRGITYAPDFVINAGGAIDNLAVLEPGGYDAHRVRAKIEQIPDRLRTILTLSQQKGISTHAAALQAARQRLEAARRVRKDAEDGGRVLERSVGSPQDPLE